MKHKLQNLLKHKLQWLALLAALLGVSQGVWATWYVRGSFPNHSWDTYYALNANNSVTIALNAGNYEFKLDNGSWSDGCGKKNDNASCGSECSIQWNNGGNIGFSAPQNGNYTFTFNLSSSPSVTITCPPPTLYLRGIESWDADAGNLMSESSGVYTITKSLTAENGVEFKICGSAWGDHEFGQGTTDNPSCDTNYTMGNGGNVHFTPTTTGSHTFTFTLSTGVLNITCPAPSCTTVNSTSAGGSATLTLSNGATEAITSNTTYNGSRTPEGSGDTYLWTVSPSPFTGATTIGTSTATSTTIRFRREGQYSVKFAAGCSSASVESSAYTVNVYPGSLYVAGPLFKGSGIWNQTETMSKSGSGTSAVYTKDLTVAYAGGEFTFQSVTSAGASNYILPHYCTTSGGSSYTNITRSGSGNNNLTSSFTLANGDNVQLKVAYRGANASGEPKYDFSLCRYPTASGFTMNRTSATYTGSNLTVTVSPKDGYGAVSNIKYAGTTNAGATYSKSSTGPTEAGTYTVYADIAATGTWCAKEQLEIGTFTINRADQATLTVSNSTTSKCYGSTFTLTSSGGSGDGAVTFAIVSGGTGTGKITDNTTLSATKAGTVNVQATKAQSANYNATTSETKTFTFNPKPTAGSVSGNSSACSGVTGGVSLTLSGNTDTGTTIQWKKKASGDSNWSNIGGATETTLSTSQTVETNYRAYVTYTATGCYAYTSNKLVSITPNASIGSVTLTSSSVCIGEGLSASAIDPVLGGGEGAWSSTDESVATITSAGVITPKAAGSTNITYTITGGCGGTVSKYATLTVKPNAAAAQYTLSNNTYTYNGAQRAVTVTPAEGAGTATIYYTGTGGTSYTKSTTAPINAGTYAITVDAASGTNYCAATKLSVGTLTVNKANQSTLTISNTATDLVYCDGANVKLTTSGGSGDGAVTYTVTSGSGSVNGDVLSPSAKGSVSVTATKAASQNFNATTSAAKTFNFNKTAPTVYTLSNVGGATTICGDPSSGAGSGTLRLANSQTGYKYQLYSNGAPIEGYAAKAGTTDSSIDFPVTSSGTYTVYAYYGDNSTNCPTRMDGEITLTISTQPRLVRSAASVTQYMPVTITSVSTDIAEWKITDNTGTPDLSSSTAYLYDKTYDAISFKGASTNDSTAKTYTIQATTAGGCSEKTTITVNPDTEACN